MTIINANSFTPFSNQPSKRYWVKGTVEVTLRNETRTVEAIKRDDEIIAYGMTGRYRTGSKAWPAKVIQHTNAKTNEVVESVSFGRDDRRGNFQKTNSLQFA